MHENWYLCGHISHILALVFTSIPPPKRFSRYMDMESQGMRHKCTYDPLTKSARPTFLKRFLKRKCYKTQNHSSSLVLMPGRRLDFEHKLRPHLLLKKKIVFFFLVTAVWMLFNHKIAWQICNDCRSKITETMHFDNGRALERPCAQKGLTFKSLIQQRNF